MVAILEQGIRKKTRKYHHCCVCDRPIPIGSAANYQNNVGAELGICTVYWHLDCVPNFSED